MLSNAPAQITAAVEQCIWPGFYGRLPPDVALTLFVPCRRDPAAMNRPLRVGDLLRCPHCRRWHPVMKWHNEGTTYTLRMLYFDCGGLRYYAGQEDLESRHETKAEFLD